MGGGIKISLKINDIFNDNYINGYFSRNRKFLTVAFVIFILLCCIGFIFPDIVNIDDYEYEELDKVTDKMGLSADNKINEDQLYDDFTYDESNLENNLFFEDYNLLGFIKLFLHNFSIDFSCIISGLLLSVPSIIITIINAFMIGSVFATVPIPIIIAGILPHGIFEIPSSIFALAGGFMLTKLEFNIMSGIFSSRYTVKDKINESSFLIKDILLTIIVVFALLYIAALIETFITPLTLSLIL